jgi:hypothetical protein
MEKPYLKEGNYPFTFLKMWDSLPTVRKQTFGVIVSATEEQNWETESQSEEIHDTAG